MQKRWFRLIAVVVVLGGVLTFHQRQRIAQIVHTVSSPAIPLAEPADAFVRAGETVPGVATTTKPSPAKPARTSPTSTVSTTQPTIIPNKINLAVPFTTQAPFAVWEQPYEDGCEEASSAMVEWYYQKKQFTSKALADAELQRLFAWEDATFGTNKDNNAEQTARMIREFYGRKKVVVKTNITAADIRAELASGRPVIVPAYGKALKNPNFKNGGPLYHMLVIKGYIGDTHFITNDPGTRNGADYTYTTQTLIGALHDWNNGDVQHGTPTMIVVYP
jgi:hypothetical protein